MHVLEFRCFNVVGVRNLDCGDQFAIDTNVLVFRVEERQDQARFLCHVEF